MTKKPMTLNEYQRSTADAKEDKRNADKRGESVSKWKKTPEAVAIDKKSVSRINAKANGKR
jgi:hypothetical protein